MILRAGLPVTQPGRALALMPQVVCTPRATSPVPVAFTVMVTSRAAVRVYENTASTHPPTAPLEPQLVP